ncbi:hypothetical protein cyc_05525 [Cyclospora cayetanensis]|uniref:Uncharacterized protein n=1 Tax=Cyclospora cayetanensis TaxID=88456 RepID=A0A1D3CSR2_9EIME|nr:hypothetical protein cyc_05525 [Cyclospora cayetanensis]
MTTMKQNEEHASHSLPQPSRSLPLRRAEGTHNGRHPSVPPLVNRKRNERKTARIQNCQEHQTEDSGVQGHAYIHKATETNIAARIRSIPDGNGIIRQQVDSLPTHIALPPLYIYRESKLQGSYKQHNS